MATTLLIADDLETNRHLARASIKSLGLPMVEVENGRQALDFILAATGPVVGLIDWEMPEIDGVEVCRQATAREVSPPLFLILLTIRDNQTDIVAGLQQGAHDYVTKPYDYAELLERVKVGVKIVELEHRLMKQSEELRDAIAQIKVLSGILPICSYCSKIRDGDHWEKMDIYVARHSEANFSHGVCPDCYAREMAELNTEADPAA